MNNWRMEPDEPLGMVQLDELLHILKALNLTDCDRRTLGIVAEATGLGKYWPQPQSPRIEIEYPPIYLLENSQR